MNGSRTVCLVAVSLLTTGWGFSLFAANAEDTAGLPDGVQAVWDLDSAFRQASPTRECVSINGLWQWQPAGAAEDAVPQDGWGYFKVPGCWPGITDYMQKDCQQVYPHAKWQDVRMRGVTAAWYQREITVPADWTGRRLAVSADYLNSFATVYVDGRKIGEMRFPAGEVDVTSLCRPGQTHMLSLLVVAMPLRGVMLSYNDTNSAREVQGSVQRRGLCGDVYLVSTPATARLTDLKVDTSVRDWTIRCECGVADLAPDGRYKLVAQVRDDGRIVQEFSSDAFGQEDLIGGRVAFAQSWQSEKLWDTHTPENQYEVTVSMTDAAGTTLDTWLPVRFGFREFWIDGRDFYLNGSRIFLCAVPLDNAQVGAAWASYDGAKECLRRLQSFGVNAVYTHNYGCEPGTHLSFAEILRAADDLGLLVSFSQPHFSQYDWDAADADQANGYAEHATFYVRAAQNHPSVVMYSTSHNATGYSEDMNPDWIDGIHADRSEWSMRNVRRALRAEAIIRSIDPSRVIYHHSSGNLSSMHTSNFYPNWVPIQEMSDWFGHWATEGVKPFFSCEYGAPFMWDWAMYRGWYKGKREFGSAVVPWDFSLAEWNAQFLGDTAYRISDQEKRNLRWEAEQFRNGRVWHRWDYPHQLGSSDFEERFPIIADYLTDNWRAFRTWGVSAVSPWQHGYYWKTRPGLNRNQRVEKKTDWQRLQRPGFSPDYLEDRYERMDLAYEPEDWLATLAAESLYRNNGPVLAYLAGKPDRFTTKDHNFLPGETIEKQIIVINNSRRTVAASGSWSIDFGQAVQSGEFSISLSTGSQDRIPIRIQLPADVKPGDYRVNAKVDFSTGESQEDQFAVHVLPPPAADAPVDSAVKVALFDPLGETARMLQALAVDFESIEADADLSSFDLLIIGKAALSPDDPAPDIARVRDGLKVIVFEQTSAALEKRLGFRVQEYGLRNVFCRVPDHPYLAGLNDGHLRDWRGESTIVPPTLEYETSDNFNGVPAVRWCGFEAPRLWRCGNRGNVATVLIEKPTLGDFLPIVDGGFSLQYSPLLEYREGDGMILFCQLDVTGRTKNDPAAERLVRSLLGHVSRTAYPVQPARKAVYAGEPAGRDYLRQAGIPYESYRAKELAVDQVLLIGTNGSRDLTGKQEEISRWLQSGGRLLMLHLDQDEANVCLTAPIKSKLGEHMAAYFPPPDVTSPFAGIGPADVHHRDPHDLPLITGGAAVIGNGVLATAADDRIVFCQQVPHRLFSRFEDASKSEQQNLRRTFRRSSFLLNRLLGNLGVRAETPLLSRFATSAVDEVRDSVVKNGEFRLDSDKNGMPEAWDLSTNLRQATCELETAQTADGLSSLRLACPEFEAGERGSVMLAQYDVAVRQGQWYRISLQAKAAGLEGTRVSLALQDTSAWKSLFDYQRFSPTGDWQEFAFVVQANATADAKTRFQIWYDQPGTLWLSGIRMTPCDPPTQGRWTRGLYVDEPQAWDDPYRFFRW